MNNATIENAETGVILAKRYGLTRSSSTESGGAVGGGTIGGGTIQPPQTALIIDANYSGGKIVATNSRFVNNKSAVEFYTYGKGNGSSFVGCTFEVNKEIAGLKNMVYIGNTNGVSFKGVDFLLNDGGANANVKGVYAVNSSFNIFGECVHNSNSGGISIWHSTPYCPNPAPEYRSRFTNFELWYIRNG